MPYELGGITKIESAFVKSHPFFYLYHPFKILYAFNQLLISKMAEPQGLCHFAS